MGRGFLSGIGNRQTDFISLYQVQHFKYCIFFYTFVKVPEDIRERYDWVEHASITCMEILHGAYRARNPNAAFFIRDPGFLSNIPAEQKKRFIDNDPLAVQQLNVLKKRLQERLVYFMFFKLGLFSQELILQSPEVHF